VAGLSQSSVSGKLCVNSVFKEVHKYSLCEDHIDILFLKLELLMVSSVTLIYSWCHSGCHYKHITAHKH
jgi:hypothetical protein